MKTIHSSNLIPVISFIWKFIRLQRFRFFSIFFLSLAWSLDATVWPYLLRSIVDIFTQYDINRIEAWPLLEHLLLYIALLWVVVETGFRSRGFLQATAFPKIEADLRMAMFDHVQHHSPKYFSTHFAGNLANKINDMAAQVTIILESLIIFFPVCITCIVSIILFFQIHLLFASILTLYILIHFSICFFFTPKCAKYSTIHGEARSTLAGKIVDSLTNNFAVNLFSRFAFEKQRVLVSQKEEQTKNHQAKRYVAYMFLFLSTLCLLGSLTISLFIILYWMWGEITTGKAIQIFNTTWNVMLALWFLSEATPPFFQAMGLASQAYSIMCDPQDVLDLPHAKDLIVKKGEIIFENVSFHYGKGALFENKNVHIKGGEKVGLVGCSGAGKSTFVNLILRFYSVDTGRILVDGQDIQNVTRDSLRKQIALIPQDTPLFHRSLAENISYSRIDASREEIEEAARLSHSDAFIKKCSDGYNSLVGERGTKLSGGERQRIAIARAALSKAPILIFDEATSALDSVTEKTIQDSLEKLSENRTTLVVAHRLSTLVKMDRILVFDQGKIVEEGSHKKLLNKKGHYAHMWNMQVNGFLPETTETS